MFLRKISFFLLASCVLLSSRFALAQKDGWNEIKGTHFIVYYQGSDKAAASDVLRRAESYYSRIANSLGYSRRSDFWLWDKRCNVYLYANKESFLQTNQPNWSSGYAIPEKRTIVSFLGSVEFLNSVLPHEMTHLIFRDFVGINNGSIPLWLDEGMAMSQEEAKRPLFDQLVAKMVDQRKWIPFRSIVQIQSMSGAEMNQAAVFYAQAQSMVRFLLESTDPNSFIQFCRNLRDGNLLEDALRKNYQKRFPTIDEFEQDWVKHHA